MFSEADFVTNCNKWCQSTILSNIRNNYALAPVFVTPEKHEEKYACIKSSFLLREVQTIINN
ncbi:MAG: hypothetical protein DIZ80_00555 [endosymbiont of Galathealinum brachiosum]|uniref:Uncharacterized protein n=1 Tax=endosymbiont of Galathealinum brachiosum TaxID=2200906 RepID=A0A370DNX1_9GAMM|nr:MAG: hypothetical protein DIZ80_00555 [endosymbiont of Galathealinum brachiosum]